MYVFNVFSTGVIMGVLKNFLLLIVLSTLAVKA